MYGIHERFEALINYSRHSFMIYGIDGSFAASIHYSRHPLIMYGMHYLFKASVNYVRHAVFKQHLDTCLTPEAENVTDLNCRP